MCVSFGPLIFRIACLSIIILLNRLQIIKSLQCFLLLAYNGALKRRIRIKHPNPNFLLENISVIKIKRNFNLPNSYTLTQVTYNLWGNLLFFVCSMVVVFPRSPDIHLGQLIHIWASIKIRKKKLLMKNNWNSRILENSIIRE